MSKKDILAEMQRKIDELSEELKTIKNSTERYAFSLRLKRHKDFYQDVEGGYEPSNQQMVGYFGTGATFKRE